MDSNYNFEEHAESLPTPSSKPITSRTPVLDNISRRISARQTSSNESHREGSRVSDELKRLIETVRNMEVTRAADRELFLEKLVSLEKQNKNGIDGHYLQSIEGMMEESVASTRKLRDSFEQLRSESRDLQENVKLERSSWNQTYKEAMQIESRLCQKVEELTEKIANIPLAANEARSEDTEGIKAEYESEIAKRDKENKEIADNLRETLEGLLVGLGRSKAELAKMTRVEQKQLVSSLVKQQLSSSAAMEALAQEAALLEKNRRDASRAAKIIKIELEESKKTQLQLERENRHLCEKIQTLSEELSEMQILVQELSTKRDAEQDKKYQEIIRSLKERLKKEAREEKTSKFLVGFPDLIDVPKASHPNSFSHIQ